MRRLILCRVRHTSGEIGEAPDEKEEEVQRFWDFVQDKVRERLKNEDFGKIRVYQDFEFEGGSKGLEVVKSLAKKPYERNAQLIVWLAERGASYMKTEELELCREYSEAASLGRLERMAELVYERDKEIAKNISETLKDGELGILFIGADHSVEKWLPSDIEIEELYDPTLVP